MSDVTLAELIHGLSLNDVPGSARRRLSLLLADMAAVCVAGRAAPVSALSAEHAVALASGAEATSLFDGRALGAAGAAFANGALANALDLDDGHRLTKGHPGAVVIPATLALAQLVDATPTELIAAILVGYEIAIRAGIALHARDQSYHATGAWGGVGAAAAGARLLRLGGAETMAAIGLAEYHAPIAPIMRSCADPAMTKDACAWGALVGVSSALLASRGFTATRSEFVDAPHDDLGTRWCVEEVYVKPYPCCRWTQGAIAATLRALAGERSLPIAAIERITLRTFAAAAGLSRAIPTDTEEAQYNIVWPVASAVRNRRFDVGDVLGPFDDPEVTALCRRVEVVVDPELTAAFPGRRLTSVDIELRGGRHMLAGPLEPPGEPDDPSWEGIIADKRKRLIHDGRDLAPCLEGAGLRGSRPSELLRVLCDASESIGGA